MEFIDLGQIVDIKSFMPSSNDMAIHVIVDFIPDSSFPLDDLGNDISELLECPDEYVLCHAGDIIKAQDEIMKLKDQVKELEGQLADTKEKSDKILYETYMETSAALYESANKLIFIDKVFTDLKKENQDLKERNEELEKSFDASIKNASFWHDKEKNVEEQLENLKKDRDYWKDRFCSVVTDVSKTLSANGVEFTVKAIDGNKWNVGIDIPELNEMKSENELLKTKVDALEKENQSLKDRLDQELSFMGDSYTKSIEKSRDYWEERCKIFEAKHEAKWSAMLQALKEKGVEVLYMGKEGVKPIIDVKIPEVGDLRKELEDLKSKTVAEARYEFKPGCLTLIYTMCDGSEQVFGMDSSEAIDATAISCGRLVPKCKACKNHRYFANTGGHYCHLPDSKYTIPGMFHINSITDEEAEGPACDKFEARKEDDCKDCKYHIDGSLRSRKDGKAMAECKSPSTRYGFCKNNCNGEKACPEFEAKE